jgi:hypothetical protein
MWEEVCQLASTISYSVEEDSMIWQFTSNGSYSVESLYKIVNFRGVNPVFFFGYLIYIRFHLEFTTSFGC